MGAQGEPKKETSRKKTNLKPKAVDKAGNVSIGPNSEDKPKNEKKTETQQERKNEVIFCHSNCVMVLSIDSCFFKHQSPLSSQCVQIIKSLGTG